MNILLIAGSEWLTARVGVVPEAAAVWLGTPRGAVTVAVLLVLRRLKIVSCATLTPRR